MGYSADMVSGETISLPGDRVPDMLAALRRVERDEGIGHISWCDQVKDYPQDIHGVAKILTDYGFIVEIADDESQIDVYDWGGDKLGGAWEGMWGTFLATIVTEPATWVMCGEDSEMWAEALDGKGGWTTKDVKISVE